MDVSTVQADDIPETIRIDTTKEFKKSNANQMKKNN